MIEAQCESVFHFGHSAAMRDLKKKVDLIAGTNVPVLISGETGTGKEALATEIHATSARSDQPFVKVSCAAIPSALMEAELFGFERGAFTGAVMRRKGKFEMAAGGTIFLDEIADLDLTLQPKLLQVLQDGNLAVLGGGEEVVADVRVICASNRDLDAEVQRGAFRQDLFYRINVVHLRLPPLRSRNADIPEFVDMFLARYQRLFGKRVAPLSTVVQDLFRAYSWPGNIRELENTVKQYVILEDEAGVAAKLEACLKQEMDEILLPDGSVSLKKHIRTVVQKSERELIMKVLRHNRWNRKRTARMLKISYRALLYKLKECGADQPVGLSYGD